MTWIRDSKRTGMEEVFTRVRKIAEGAALMAGCESTVTVQGGDYELLVNMTGEKLVHGNLSWLGAIKYTEEEQEFARTIQRATGVEPKGLNGEIQPFRDPKPNPAGGSTDVGDVSWVVPTAQFRTATFVPGTPGHSWQAVACSGSSVGRKGMVVAAKVLALSAWELLTTPAEVDAARESYRKRLEGKEYKSRLPANQKPPLDYRNR